jgi:hypothetical protein
VIKPGRSSEVIVNIAADGTGARVTPAGSAARELTLAQALWSPS